MFTSRTHARKSASLLAAPAIAYRPANRKAGLFIVALLAALLLAAAPLRSAELEKPDFPYVFHLVQAKLWDAAVAEGKPYYPPTYEVDGFTHGTSNPAKLLNVANHFYPDVPGKWYGLRMTVESLAATGVTTIFEGTAPVGDKAPDFEGATDELFPHILGGIDPAAVLEVHSVRRASDGTFLSVEGVTP